MSSSPAIPVFASSPLDRAAHLRADEETQRGLRHKADSVLLVFWEGRPFLAGRSPERRVVRLPMRVAEALPVSGPVVFLGQEADARSVFAVALERKSDPSGAGEPLEGMGVFDEMRRVALSGDLEREETAMLAQASALLSWHATHGHCARCGAPTAPKEAGYKRMCASCGAEHFPRTDPVVIMVAVYENRAFLGRQAGFPPGMYSALAGFVEPGETIEGAVARELHEEAQIRVRAVRYFATQPWPYPMSLMIGCMAEAEAEAFKVDGVEIEEGRWFDREELARALRNPRDAGFWVPPPMAIAHHLIRAFVDG